jgi:uncharacterized protein YjbI with pentapeptide repeats
VEDSQGQHKQEQPEAVAEELAFSELKQGNAWGESVTKRRAVELEGTLSEWQQERDHGERRGPFDGIRLSGADVFWLVARVTVGAPKPTAIAKLAKRLLSESDELAKRMLLPAVGDLHLEGAQLEGANLNYALLRYAHLEGAYLFDAFLQGAMLMHAHLERAVLSDAHLEGAFLTEVHAEGAFFVRAHMEGARPIRAHLEKSHLQDAHLEDSYLSGAHLEGANLRNVHLQGARLYDAHFEDANLKAAHFEGKVMSADGLALVRQWAPDFEAELPPADLQGAFFDRGSILSEATIGDTEHGYIAVRDVQWGDVNLSVVDFTNTRRGFPRTRIEAIELGDERKAYKPEDKYGKPKDNQRRLQEYKAALRANRQLATALRSQGLNEDADRFAYKAQRLQRQVLWRQGRKDAAVGSWFLDLIAGYGYRPLRAFAAYAFVIALFTGLYLLNSHFVAPYLTWNEALVLSMSSFHGRGFFNPNIQLGDTYAQLAAVEALVGLFIEVTFIATFTQRFFAR